MSERARGTRGEEFWCTAFRRRERSGLTVAAFCEQEGLTASAYYFWQRKMKHVDGKTVAAGEVAVSQNPPVPREQALAAVRVIADAPSAAEVEIVAENGYVVRVGPDTTTEHLRRVLQTVREIG